MSEQAYNSASPKQVWEHEKSAKLDRETQLAELKVLMRQEPFLKFMERVLGVCHIDTVSKSVNSIERNIFDGERHIGLWLQRELVQADAGICASLLVRNFIGNSTTNKQEERDARPRK